MEQSYCAGSGRREPWNKGKLVRQKSPFRLKETGASRIRLQLGERLRELALFNLAIDSKLRSCDLVRLRVRDVSHADRVASRAIVMQQKTQRPVRFEITEQTRDTLCSWIRRQGLRLEDFVLKPTSCLASSFNAPVRAYCPTLGERSRPSSRGVCHPYAAPQKHA
jgi:hypothetical protein